MKKYDHFEMRCPRLGGEVTFSYCRQEGGDIPCLRVITCWHPFFPVEQYLKKSMKKEAWDRFVNEIPKNKIITIVELIEKAKKQAGKKASKDNGSF